MLFDALARKRVHEDCPPRLIEATISFETQRYEGNGHTREA